MSLKNCHELRRCRSMARLGTHPQMPLGAGMQAVKGAADDTTITMYDRIGSTAGLKALPPSA